MPDGARSSEVPTAPARVPGARIKILHVIESLGLGGAENVVANLVAHADTERFEPEVAALATGGGVAERIASWSVPVHVLGKKPGFDLKAARALRALVRARRPALIHTHNPIANHWSILATLGLRGAPPIVTTEHSVHYRGKIRRWYPALRAVLDMRNAAIVGVCGAVTASYERIDPLNRRRYRTIHNGIERPAVPAPSRRESLRRELGLGPGDVVVGSVGNLRAPKAYGDLLDALSRLAPEFPSVTAVIVGDGPMAEELRARAEELGLGRRVRWLGRRSDVADLYGVMDVYVLSSRREGFPMALIEAAAACVPIVATDVGGVSEIVRPGETGLLVPAGDPPRLADAIRTLLEDRALARRLAEGGQRAYERAFTADGMARSTEALYLEVLGRSSDAPAGARRPS